MKFIEDYIDNTDGTVDGKVELTEEETIIFTNLAAVHNTTLEEEVSEYVNSTILSVFNKYSVEDLAKLHNVRHKKHLKIVR